MTPSPRSPTFHNLAETCPNAHVRQQTGAALLLDCRAYELVSAANTGGYDVESDLVAGQTPFASYPEAESPPKVLYAVHDGGYPGHRGIRPTAAPIPTSPRAAKTAGLRAMSASPAKRPLRTPTRSPPFRLGADASLDTFAFGGSGGCSPCFGQAASKPVSLSAFQTANWSRAWPPAQANPEPTAKPDGYIAKDLSANGEHFIFGSTSQFAPGGNDNTGDVSIYDRNLKTGETHVVSKTPATEDSPGTLPCLQGAGSATPPTRLKRNRRARHLHERLPHPLRPKGLDGRRSATSTGTSTWTIGDSIKSIDLTPGTTHGVLYDGMTADGSKVFLRPPTTPLSSADTDESADLYEAEVSERNRHPAPDLHRRPTDTGNTDACDPVSNENGEHWNTVGSTTNCDVVAIGGGVARADRWRRYFLSPERLDGSSNGTANQPNLYLAAPGAAPRFIATLNPNDPVVLDSVKEAEARHTADFEVTPTGEFAAFTTIEPLDEYENAGYSEIYRYDAPRRNARLRLLQSDQRYGHRRCHPRRPTASASPKMVGSSSTPPMLSPPAISMKRKMPMSGSPGHRQSLPTRKPEFQQGLR